jgi:hypothetical protein
MQSIAGYPHNDVSKRVSFFLRNLQEKKGGLTSKVSRVVAV